jgi:hypothetical protein
MTDDCENELDALLNEALGSYADVEPDALLRARISQRVAEASPARPWRLWTLAGSMVCATVVVFALLLHSTAHAPVSPSSIGPSIANAPESVAPVTATARQIAPPHAVLAARRTHRSERRALPRSNSFPGSAPLTAEEVILLRFAQENPEQARQVLTSLAKDDAPLETKPLSMEPIHIAALSDPEPRRPED